MSYFFCSVPSHPIPSVHLSDCFSPSLYDLCNPSGMPPPPCDRRWHLRHQRSCVGSSRRPDSRSSRTWSTDDCRSTEVASSRCTGSGTSASTAGPWNRRRHRRRADNGGGGGGVVSRYCGLRGITTYYIQYREEIAQCVLRKCMYVCIRSEALRRLVIAHG